MALYLDEVWLKDPSPERMKEFTRLIGAAAAPVIALPISRMPGAGSTVRIGLRVDC